MRTVPEQLYAKLANLFVEPQLYCDNMSRKDTEAWLEAMVKEISMIGVKDLESTEILTKKNARTKKIPGVART